MELSITLDNFNQTYSVGETITGNLLIKSNEKHSEINYMNATLTGIFSIKNSKVTPPQLSTVKFYSKRISLAQTEKLALGSNTFPLRFPLISESGKDLNFYESYHGVIISVSYELTAEAKTIKGLLTSEKKRIVILVPGMGIKTDFMKKNVVYNSIITPDKVDKIKLNSEDIPKFRIEYHVDSINCDMNKGFHGYCTIRECSMTIKSIELQFLRHEEVILGGNEKYEEKSEIQNLQIGDGDVNKDMEIPLFMLFPRVFSCASMETKDYKVGFIMNLVIVLMNGYVISDSFPVNTWRS